MTEVAAVPAYPNDRLAGSERRHLYIFGEGCDSVFSAPAGSAIDCGAARRSGAVNTP
jgi:hypothetical protein